MNVVSLPILSALINFSSRLGSFDFWVRDIRVLHGFLLRPLPFPLLDSLIIRVLKRLPNRREHWSPHDHSLDWTVFSNPERLRSVTLDVDEITVRQLILPSTMTELDLRGTGIFTPRFLTIVQACPHMKRGVFFVEPTLPVSLNGELLFEGFKLPNLRRFVLASLRNVPLFSWTIPLATRTLSDYITPGSLRSLVLAQVPVSNEDLLAFLVLTPKLADLRIDLDVNLTHGVQFLPDLSHLKELITLTIAIQPNIDASSRSPFSEDVFLDMITSRLIPGMRVSPLQSIHLFVYHAWRQWVDASLRSLLSRCSENHQNNPKLNITMDMVLPPFWLSRNVRA
ncbi:hypothetical protein Hypma_016366 [Hypsizygus marmoreus]|uniref:F-box domain-containing protein n=1 Tax=Hypsizygus marmoreus TaxID=39966 RepID=A0A369J709_HYPMA|nr:hypothetical protein Hypma_016366 [Hypsizygus marmoreus]